MTQEHFVGQFILTLSPIEVPSNWRKSELNGWYLYTEPSLPVRPLCDSIGNRAGFILGYFVNRKEYLPEKVSIDVTGIGTDAWADDDLFAFGGRWICIVLTGAVSRIYLDPSGSLPVVFDRENRRVASSSTLIGREIDNALIQALQLPNSGLYIPFGYTAYKGILRLLPNHYLDLTEMICRRHWFRRRKDGDWNIDKAAEVLADVLKTTVEAVSRKQRITVPLTGGRDSRMLLAACREVIDNIEFVTIRGSSVDVDVHLTEILRERLRIRHRFITRESSSKEELDSWQMTVGYCVGGRAWLDHSSYNNFAHDSILMPSICGEIGRGFFYRKNDKPHSRFSGQDLLLRMKIPRIDCLEAGANVYLDELYSLGLDHFEALDHVYNEQRLGSWASPTELGGDRFTSGKMWPLCSRRAIAVLHETPIEYKLTHDLPSRVIDIMWPELNSLPFNKFTGPFSFIWEIQRMATRAPKYIADRLRARGFL